MSMGNNKPTILLGAGAAIDIKAPTTQKITEEIIKQDKYTNYSVKDVYGKCPTFSAIKKIYQHLEKNYLSKPNFEQVFHILEMLASYNWVWFRNCKNPELFSLFAPFVVPITNIVGHNEWNNLYSLINQCQADIMEMVYKYDVEYKDKKDSDYKWYKTFWNKFEGFDLFNLNYDTTIEQSLPNYCDGFVDVYGIDVKKFDPKTLFRKRCNYKVCHLHGSIVYYNYENYDAYEYKSGDMYKWNDASGVIEKIKDGAIKNNSSNQGGENIHIGPIITGLRKPDKLTVVPYNYYHHYLCTSILNNRSLLIVGYSFSDLYINDLIERMNMLYGKNKRIVIITKWKPMSLKDVDGKVTKTFKCKEWDVGNHREYMFIERMLHDESFLPGVLDYTIQKKTSFTSKNGDVKLFVYGFKNAVKYHRKEIVEFLTK